MKEKMVGGNSNQKKIDALTEFTRYLYEKNYLDENNEIDVTRAKNLFDEYKIKHGCKGVNFCHMFVTGFRNNVVSYQVDERNILHFKGNQLNFLLQEKSNEAVEIVDNQIKSPNTLNKEARPKRKMVKIVDHSVSFRSENTFSEEVKKSLEKMKVNPNYTEEHMKNLEMIQSIRSNRCDISHRSWKGLSARIEGHTSLDNIVIACNIEKTINIEIENSGSNKHIINSIRQPVILKKGQVLRAFRDPVVFEPKFITKLPFKVCFPEHGDYLFCLILEHSSGHLLSVEMVFRVLSDSVADLGPIEPYEGSYKVVYEEVYEEIVPAKEHRKRPKVSSEDAGKRLPLRLYGIPKYLSLLLNMGFRESGWLRPEYKEALTKMKALLNVPDKKYPLTEENYADMLKLLLHMEEHQMNKDIHDYDAEDQILKRVKNSNNLFELEVPGLSEHRPSLVIGDSVYVKESKTSGNKYEGEVEKIQEMSVLLSFNKKFVDSVYVDGKKFFVSFTFNRYTIRVEHQAVELAKKHNIVGKFFTISQPSPSINQEKITDLIWVNRDIGNNEEQKQAVFSILHKTAYPSPYIIFGPPGTGKTATLVEAINQAFKRNPDDKILVLAPSNHAADEITKRLLQNMPKSTVFRYVAMSFPYSKICEEVRPHTNYEGGKFYQPSLATIIKYNIVISTLSNAGRLVNAGISSKHFSYVMIDEAGHATETETLVGIAGILSDAEQPRSLLGQVVLVGDPEQLGAIIHSKKAEELGFGVSMLERMMKTIPAYQKTNGQYNSALITKLVNNYRSHEKILEFPNKRFYDGDLQSKGDHMINVALDWEKLPNPRCPLIFHSVIGKDQREKNSPSFFNLQEVDVVFNYLKQLIGTKMKGIKIGEEHIGVIAPYRKQVEKIEQVCKKLPDGGKKLLIGSVEQIQGSERLIIIISTTRSTAEYLKIDHKFHLGFLKNPKRMNVALTRAKALLIVIGNPYILQYDDNWRQLIQYCQENKCTEGTKFTLDDADTVPMGKLCSEMESLTVDTGNNDGKNPEGTADFSRGQI